MKLATSDLHNKKLKRYWDNKLSPSANNPWPLAPRDLVRMSKVHYDNYKKENGGLGAFISILVLRELKSILKMLAHDKSVAPPPFSIEILGIGLGHRDLRWINTAIEQDFRLRARDISSVSKRNMVLLFQQFIDERRLKPIIGEIEETMETDKINPRRTAVYFASQFFQVLPRRKMRSTLGKLGLILNQWPSDINIQPRIYVVHPLPEDNTGAKIWNGIHLGGVEWGDTTPYSMDELRTALESKLRGRKVSIKVLKKQNYYHQRYAFLKISLVQS
jgi:hypothetical protein